MFDGTTKGKNEAYDSFAILRMVPSADVEERALFEHASERACAFRILLLNYLHSAVPTVLQHSIGRQL